ncbi:MAG TPA: hypothetical protein VFR15_05990 [Chloroflexia bacterium]|nr:hypothetical protein [Chloroflexia bacterium]
MDYYPQPRPVLYGTSAKEAPPRTQTAPVRIGPPRYPPAPPSTGYAPEPFPHYGARPRVTIEGVLHPAVLLIVEAASAYSLLQVAMGRAGLVSIVVGAAGLIVLACLQWRTVLQYRLAVSLAALHVLVGGAFGQWQSPALWIAVAVTLYILRPTMLEQYEVVPAGVLGGDIARYRRQSTHRRRVRVASRRPARLEPWEWRIRW